MLFLENIKKDYVTGTETVEALKGVTVGFRDCEFVSVLGPSGCGKTTLLNIIGGLDGYTGGDLRIGGVSTKRYRDRDWDNYRNHSVGFVFQSYNLIPHQSVLANVELALTLSGVPRAERRRRAREALEKVGLGDQLRKRPNQLSGGQMQRVAIARAIVNDPEILLADEPTGALDTETSVQVMELLKEIARDRLVVMVTHNPQLAETYSTRIIRLLDGRVTDDSMPLTEAERSATEPPAKQKAEKKRARMSALTAFSLSLHNLLTKKARTVLVAFAGSIGIIGIALILSLSSGATDFIGRVQKDTLSSYPISVERQGVDYSELLRSMTGASDGEDLPFEEGKIYSDDRLSSMMNSMVAGVKENDLVSFKRFLEENDAELREYVSAVAYRYSTPLPIYAADTENGILQVNPATLMSDLGIAPRMMTASSSAGSYDVFDELLDNPELIASQYDVLAGRLPENKEDLVLIVDEKNRVTDYVLYVLGVKDQAQARAVFDAVSKGESLETEQISLTYDEILSLTFRLLPATSLYEKDEATGIWLDRSEDAAFLKQTIDAEGLTLRIVGILRPSDASVATSASGGVGYLSSLTDYLIGRVAESDAVRAQKENPETDIFTGLPFSAGGQTMTMEEIRAYLALLPAEKAAEENAKLAAMKAAGMSDEAVAATYAKTLSGSSSTYERNLQKLGVSSPDDPAAILLYPKDFDAKDALAAMIDRYNGDKTEEEQISYTDYVGIMMKSVTVIINAISYILIAFVAVSLVVSSIMIGIITYISVLERTKEIGVLRAVGASKRDVSRVFNAETFIIGLAAGSLGIALTLLLLIPVNAVIRHFTDIAGLAALPLAGALVLILISVLLTLLAGLFPARLAAKKDPVIALRSE
ncbi:MAG: ABC transporter ATP-binding protein/permease [Clostridia bacterium]|nr:ABC transporter ATP-binding protein/permease [Clostridia bacterium]